MPTGRVFEHADRRKLYDCLALREVLRVTAESEAAAGTVCLYIHRAVHGSSTEVICQRITSEQSPRRFARSNGRFRRRGFGMAIATGPSGLAWEVDFSADEAGVSGLVPDAQVAVARASAPVAPWGTPVPILRAELTETFRRRLIVIEVRL